MTVGRIPSVEGGIQPTLLTAKGDLISATAASTVARLAVGSNDQILVADSTASTGLAWSSLGTYTSWTPTLTNITIGNGTVTAAYVQIGKHIHAQIRITLGSTSTVGGNPGFSLPVTKFFVKKLTDVYILHKIIYCLQNNQEKHEINRHDIKLIYCIY